MERQRTTTATSILCLEASSYIVGTFLLLCRCCGKCMLDRGRYVVEVSKRACQPDARGKRRHIWTLYKVCQIET
jgi:hypothetical protein